MRAAIADDVAMAEAVRVDGGSVALYGGDEEISYRMYPDGWSQLREGWVKNLASGATSIRWWVLLAAVLWVSVLVQGAAWLVAAPFRDDPIPGVALYLTCAAQLAWMFGRVGTFKMATALLYPLALGAFAWFFVWSLIGRARGSVSWRGRSVDLRAS